MRRAEQTQIVDCETPVSLYNQLRALGANVFLDSPQPHAKGERYAIVGFGDPVIAHDSLEHGLRRFRDAERQDPATTRFGHADLPFVGGLMFAGGGDFPFLCLRVPTVAVFDNFKRLLTVSSVADDGEAIAARICDHMRAAGRPQLTPIVLTSPGNAPAASSDGEPIHVSGAYHGDPFRLFRTLRGVAGGPFMAFFEAQRLSLAGSGSSELLTIRGRRLTVRTPLDGAIQSTTAGEAVASTLRPMLVDEPQVECERRAELGGGTIEIDLASGKLASGRTAGDALTAVMRSRPATAPPVVGFLGWNGDLNSAAMETVVVVNDGRLRASDWSERHHNDPLRRALALAS